jgi:hypothetical protein
MKITGKTFVPLSGMDDEYCYRVVLRKDGDRWLVETYWRDDEEPVVEEHPDGPTAWEVAEAIADLLEALLQVAV